MTFNTTNSADFGRRAEHIAEVISIYDKQRQDAKALTKAKAAVIHAFGRALVERHDAGVDEFVSEMIRRQATANIAAHEIPLNNQILFLALIAK
jgi:broad specificity phosphatase PhoE